MKNEKIICITGSSGYVGEMLVDQFSAREDIKTIVGIDLIPPSSLTKNNPKLVFIQANMGDNTWQEKVASYQPEVVIHTAWQIRQLKDKALHYKMNITGSDNVFDFVFKYGFVQKLLYFSTVASYGATLQNKIDYFFREEDPLRKSDYFYAEEKRISEVHLKQKFEQTKAEKEDVPQVFIIRPASITGPRGRFMRLRFTLQSALSGQLKNSKNFWHSIVSSLVSFTPVTEKWCRQFVHEDDITDIVRLLSFTDIPSEYEVFNAAPPGPIVLGKDMAKAVNKKAIQIHPRLVQFGFFVARTISLGKIPTSKHLWKFYSYPIPVDGSKITKKYGYKYHANAIDAFAKIDGRYEKYVK